MQPSQPETSTQAPAKPGFPLARLDIPGNPLEPLAHAIPQERLAAAGVRSYQAFTATAPRVWLLVFEFADQGALLDRLADLDALVGPADAPPYDRAPSYTGKWLLVTGFPADKPVSPEMAAAQVAFQSAWAGEE